MRESQPKVLHLNVMSGQTTPRRTRVGKYTLPIFLERAKLTRGDKFDYSLVTEEHMKGKDSTIPVICTKCRHISCPSINHHINRKDKCVRCSKKVRWTLEKFLAEARTIHQNKFDYSLITKDHIKGIYSILDIICIKCKYQWKCRLNNHIHRESKCPNCSGQSPWTLEKVLDQGKSLHCDEYNYSLITEDHIKGKDSKIPVICNTCKNLWHPTIHNHIYTGTKCPHCNVFHGYSRSQIKWLTHIMNTEKITIRHALSDQGEYTIPGVGKVDGYCSENNTVYEYHGYFWHGHPDMHNPNDLNPISGKTFGELYQKTLEKDNKIRNFGYNLITKWGK